MSKIAEPLTFTMNEYQADTASTAIYKFPVIYPALGLASEAGEVLGKIKKMIRDNDVRFDGKKRLTEAQREDIAYELGDVLWYVAALSRDIDYSLNDVAVMNLWKLEERKARNALKGSGDKR